MDLFNSKVNEKLDVLLVRVQILAASVEAVNKKLDKVLLIISDIQGKEVKIMATLDQILADVQAESGAIDSVSALIAGLRQQLADVLSGVSLPPSVQAKVDEIFTVAEENKNKIAAAIGA